MAIGANSYGSVAGCEARARKYTTSGSFDASSHPTVTQVEGFINEVSAIINTLLAQAGFTIPVGQVSAKLALDEFTVDIAVALIEDANSSGRFHSEATAGRGAFDIILSEAKAFVIQHAQGLEDLGAARSRHLATAWMGDKPVAIAEVA